MQVLLCIVIGTFSVLDVLQKSASTHGFNIWFVGKVMFSFKDS